MKDFGDWKVPLYGLGHVSDSVLRDWFAGEFISGVAAADGNSLSTQRAAEEWASRAYMFADAMLAERAKRKS